MEAVYGPTPSLMAWTFKMAQMIAMEKLEDPDQVWPCLSELLVLLPGRLRFMLLALTPLALVPRPALAAVQRSLAAWRNRSLLRGARAG